MGRMDDVRFEVAGWISSHGEGEQGLDRLGSMKGDLVDMVDIHERFHEI